MSHVNLIVADKALPLCDKKEFREHTSTMGGRGTVGGTIIGTLIIGVLINALTFMEVPVNAQSAIKGLVILIAIVVDALFTL